MKKILLVIIMLAGNLYAKKAYIWYTIDCENTMKDLRQETPDKCLKAIEIFEKKIQHRKAIHDIVKKMYGENLYNAGVIYAQGKIEVRDMKKAVKMYLKAYDIGYRHPNLLVNLASSYFYGEGGLKQDKIKAYQLAQEAVKKGSVLAQKQLDEFCRVSPWVCK